MNRLWQETLSSIEKTLSPQHFSTWIKAIHLVGIEKDLVRLQVPNRFVHDWIRDHYLAQIQETISRIGAVSYRLHLDIALQQTEKNNPSLKETEKTVRQEKTATPLRENSALGTLNGKYVFDEFVSGSSNQFAFAAAMAVANNPATTYNPLFIYGGVGLGKTHLINAIGHRILQKNPQTNICYCTSEKFMNESD